MAFPKLITPPKQTGNNWSAIILLEKENMKTTIAIDSGVHTIVWGHNQPECDGSQLADFRNMHERENSQSEYIRRRREGMRQNGSIPHGWDFLGQHR